jgi:hypothetical protein
MFGVYCLRFVIELCFSLTLMLNVSSIDQIQSAFILAQWVIFIEKSRIWIEICILSQNICHIDQIQIYKWHYDMHTIGQDQCDVEKCCNHQHNRTAIHFWFDTTLPKWK